MARHGWHGLLSQETRLAGTHRGAGAWAVPGEASTSGTRPRGDQAELRELTGSGDVASAGGTAEAGPRSSEARGPAEGSRQSPRGPCSHRGGCRWEAAGTRDEGEAGVPPTAFAGEPSRHPRDPRYPYQAPRGPAAAPQSGHGRHLPPGRGSPTPRTPPTERPTRARPRGPQPTSRAGGRRRGPGCVRGGGGAASGPRHARGERREAVTCRGPVGKPLAERRPRASAAECEHCDQPPRGSRNGLLWGELLARKRDGYGPAALPLRAAANPRQSCSPGPAAGE